MDVEHNKAKEANVHYQAIKDNIASYSSASGNVRPDTWKTKFQNKEKWKSKNSHHDCEKSPNCNTKWESLGCSKIYELHTVEERRNYLKEKGKCFCCGREFHGVPRYPKQMCAWDSELEVVRCRQGGCRLGAAVCFEHQGENASHELKAWLDSKKIKTTVTSIRSYPCHGRSFSTPKTTKVSENIRSQLQKGETSTNFSNEQLTEFFTADLQKKGKKKVKVYPIPEGEVAFIFCKIKGKRSDVQAFIDDGCNCAIMKDGIPQREFNSCMLRPGPIQIDVATGVQVEAQGEWGTVLPLTDGSYQVLRSLTVPRVTSQMPTLHLRKLLDKIKDDNSEHADFNSLQNLQVPDKLGGEIDMILGIQFASVHPEPVFSLPSGLKIYKSKFMPAKKGELACIGGPLGAIDCITANTGAKSCVRYLANLLSDYSSGYVPKIDFFPSADTEMERGLDRFSDKEIPGLEEYLDLKEANCVSDEINDDQTEIDHHEAVTCCDCGDVIKAAEQCVTIQTELKRFLQQQEAGLDATFRCLRCRNCKTCLKGAGQERMSMKQEAEQELIRQSVYIDKKLGRAVAKLPFLTDPTDKLKDNSNVAVKRLENVCRKYGSDENVKQMLEMSMQKLIKNGHIVLLDDLPKDQRERIKKASSSYTIPSDVNFKEGSVSTPARWVFDAACKTSLGYSLNDLLAKGAIDMVRLIDMVMDWRMGASAFCGDIRQFYNTILLAEEHWQYQKVMLKKSLDPHSKILTGIIRTLIYGVKPVGNQCEEVIKLLADEVWSEHPDVAKLLVFKRYVGDFGQSTT